MQCPHDHRVAHISSNSRRPHHLHSPAYPGTPVAEVLLQMGCRMGRLFRAFLSGVTKMNLMIWLPAMFLLGLVVFAFMFASIPACDKV